MKIDMFSPISGALGLAPRATEKISVSLNELLVAPTDKAAMEVPSADKATNMAASASSLPPEPLSDKRRWSLTEKEAATALKKNKMFLSVCMYIVSGGTYLKLHVVGRLFVPPSSRPAIVQNSLC